MLLRWMDALEVDGCFCGGWMLLRWMDAFVVDGCS